MSNKYYNICSIWGRNTASARLRACILCTEMHVNSGGFILQQEHFPLGINRVLFSSMSAFRWNIVVQYHLWQFDANVGMPQFAKAITFFAVNTFLNFEDFIVQPLHFALWTAAHPAGVSLCCILDECYSNDSWYGWKEALRWNVGKDKANPRGLGKHNLNPLQRGTQHALPPPVTSQIPQPYLHFLLVLCVWSASSKFKLLLSFFFSLLTIDRGCLQIIISDPQLCSFGWL